MRDITQTIRIKNQSLQPPLCQHILKSFSGLSYRLKQKSEHGGENSKKDLKCVKIV